MTKPLIYLAGPSVFRPDAKAIGITLKALCTSHGCEGLWPLDNDPGPRLPDVTSREYADLIFQGNRAMIVTAGAIVADISPFRGPHMDVGTAWEIGFGLALGIPTFAWSSAEITQAYRYMGDGKLINRIWCEETPTGWRDANGNLVEDFDLADNLMIGCSIRGPYKSAEEAIIEAARQLRSIAA